MNYRRTPIYRDGWRKGFCRVNRGVPVNALAGPDRGVRYIGANSVNFLYRGSFLLPVNRGSSSGKLGSDCINMMYALFMKLKLNIQNF